MTRVSIPNGGLITCNAKACLARFHTNSLPSLVHIQAKAAGWDRVWAWQVTRADSPRLKYDVCPDHAKLAAEAKANRPAIMKQIRDERMASSRAERAQKKAKRAEDALAKREAKKGETVERQAKKKADAKAARAAAKADHLRGRHVNCRHPRTRDRRPGVADPEQDPADHRVARSSRRHQETRRGVEVRPARAGTVHGAPVMRGFGWIECWGCGRFLTAKIAAFFRWSGHVKCELASPPIEIRCKTCVEAQIG